MAVMADGCNNLIEDFLCFVLKQIYACKMYTMARLPHEGRIYFLLYNHSVSSSATTVTPFVVRLFLLIRLTSSSKLWGLPRPHRNSCYLALSSPFLLPPQYCVHRGVRNWTFSPPFCLSQTLLSCWPRVSSVFVRTVITISVRHVHRE